MTKTEQLAARSELAVAESALIQLQLSRKEAYQ